MPEASTATPTANDLDVEQGAQGPERQQTISTNSSLEKRLSDAKEAALEDAVTPLDKEVVEDLEDGGFWGWVVVICVMTQSMALWGMNTTFGIYLSFYAQNDYFAGTPQSSYAFVGGLSLGCCFLIAPLSNYLTVKFGYKTFMSLMIEQGVMFGIGQGLLFIPAIPLISQWHRKRRSLANGIAGSGSGIGALAWALETRVTIERLGLRWALIINGLISLALLIPSTLLLRSRTKQLNAKFSPLRLTLLADYGFACVCSFAFFSVLAYVTCIFSLATYATQGLGLSQGQAATLQAVLATGQIIGRPILGWVLDSLGPINGSILASVFTSLTCLAIWMVSRSFAPLVVFSLLNGATGGLVFAAVSPLSAEVLSVQHLGSALAIIWMVLVLPSTFSQAIASALAQYSRYQLGRTGADAYLISIGFAGGGFAVAALSLLGAKRKVQGDWRILTKS